MPKTELMPIGIDFGLEGGIVALHGTEVVMHLKMPVIKARLQDGESTSEQQRLAKSQSKVALKQKRHKKTRELLPGVMTIYDTNAIERFLAEAAREATAYGYLGLFVAIEEPQMFIGKSSPRTYFASGRGQNALMLACRNEGLTPVWFSPKHWKSTLGLDDDKENSLIWASEYLQIPEVMKRDHDLCEAALLAFFVQTHASRYLTRFR